MSTPLADPAAEELRVLLQAEMDKATPAEVAESCAAYEADPDGFVTQTVEAMASYSDPQEPLPEPDVMRGIVIDLMAANCA